MTTATAISTPLRRLADRARSVTAGYATDEHRPLGGYAVTMSTYAGVVAAGSALAARRGHRLPERFSWSDVALVTVATHKLSRMIAKDSVASPIRAPFTHYEGVSGPAELAESVRGTGLRKAVGELVTCPFCLAMWISTAFTGGLVVAPRATRAAATVLTAVAGADTLQLAYAGVEQAVE